MIPANEDKNEYAALMLMGWGRTLQSIVFDKIYFPGPWEISLVHPEKSIYDALLLDALVLQPFWRTLLLKGLK